MSKKDSVAARKAHEISILNMAKYRAIREGNAFEYDRLDR